MKKHALTLLVVIISFFSGNYLFAQVNPDSAEVVEVDRFSMEAGHLQVRDSTNNLPMPNEPVNFDQGPFITKGFGPNGEFVTYYNFDIQPTVPAPIYVLFRDGDTTPVAGQLNIIDDIPGEADYNDFWQVHKVTVPANYIANTVTSLEEITMANYPVEATDMLVNCPVVPKGSTATLRLNNGSPELTRGWYKNKVVYYFNFFEKELMTDSSGKVPLADIFVTFNINPNEPGGGPASGFKMDPITGRTHNVTSALPADSNYSPLWDVNVLDNMDFDSVKDLQSAMNATTLAEGVATVNCPIVEIAFTTDVKQEDNSRPDQYVLNQNYPNPFNPSTKISFSIPERQNVSLKIYNSLGQEVAVLVNNSLNAGNYSVEWKANNTASGIYFYQIITNNFIQSRKMILLR